MCVCTLERRSAMCGPRCQYYYKTCRPVIGCKIRITNVPVFLWKLIFYWPTKFIARLAYLLLNGCLNAVLICRISVTKWTILQAALKNVKRLLNWIKRSETWLNYWSCGRDSKQRCRNDIRKWFKKKTSHDGRERGAFGGLEGWKAGELFIVFN